MRSEFEVSRSNFRWSASDMHVPTTFCEYYLTNKWKLTTVLKISNPDSQMPLTCLNNNIM